MPTALEDTFDWLLNNLENVEEVNGQGEHRANCPVCNDTGQHLYFKLEADKVVLHCHHGCAFDLIALALGQPRTAFFKSNGQTPHMHQAPQVVTATYVYFDENGQRLHRTVKMGPIKRFFQEHWDGQAWIKGLGKCRRVLYHLPELDSSRPGDYVYLCEGEKSADAITNLGALATTNAMGAGNWRVEYDEFLRGRRVVILPDNDDAGIQHTQKVGQSLWGKAHSIQALVLPSLKYKPKHGEDPWDWVDRGGTLAELIKLTKTAPYLHPQSKKATKQDYLSALAFFNYRFRLNICTDRVECNEESLTDVVAAQIRVRMRDFGYEHATRFEDAYLAAAADTPFHPVQAYLDGLHWDGQDHIDKLASYFPDVNQVFGLFLRRWLIGAVAKAYKAEQNRMLVLDGPQNLGKSHFARWLCAPLPGLFVEGPINPDNKDDLIRLMQGWIWEVAELGSTTRRADQEALKYFLTMRQVTARKPYGKYDIIKPALASFIGTVNNEAGILSDPTGSRRFMVAHLVDIDHSYDGQVDVDQVWAQAKAAYDAGETWQLAGNEADLATQANEEYQIEDPLVSYLLERFDVTGDLVDELPTSTILRELHMDGWRLRTPRAESMALASVFKNSPQFVGVEKTPNTSKRGYTGLVVKGRLSNP